MSAEKELKAAQTGSASVETTSISDTALDQPETGSSSKNHEPKTNSIRHNGVIAFILWWLEDQWFLVALAILIAISSQVQVPATQQQLKLTVISYLCVSIIFLITGLTLPTRTLINNYSRWKIHLFVQIESYLMTSALFYGVVSACATNPNFMDPGLLVGLIFLGCVATTISSNVVMTKTAHGNVALTVVQSTIGNFLGPFVSPALVSMYTSSGAWYTDILPKEQGGQTEIYRRVFKQLGLSIFVPMVAGQIIQNLFPDIVKFTIERYRIYKLSSLSLLIIIWSTYDGAFRSRAFDDIPASNMIFIVFISIAIFFACLAVCFLTCIPWLPKADTISIIYCVPAKTPAMGVPLANVMYLGLSPKVQSRIAIPMVIYQALAIFAGSLLTIPCRRWIRGEEEQKRRAEIVEGSNSV